jgi:hypothetical protein
MEATYCRRWNNVLKKPLDPITAEDARRLDAERDYYTVILSEDSTPRRYVEVNWGKEYLGVYFLDHRLRPHLRYTFRRAGDGRMFMTEVFRWEYPDDQARFMGDATLTDHMRYNQDGTGTREVRDDVAQEVRRQEFAELPLEYNWEPVPTFGDWEHVSRRDRSVGAVR